MSYTPTEWKVGDKVTSTKLNKLENGVANSGGGETFVVHLNNQTLYLDKTWNEIDTAFLAGKLVYLEIVTEVTSSGYENTTTDFFPIGQVRAKIAPESSSEQSEWEVIFNSSSYFTGDGPDAYPHAYMD